MQALLARAPERLRGALARGALLLLGQRRSRRVAGAALALGQGRLGHRRARDRRQPERRRRLLLGGRLHGQLRAGPGRGEGAVAGDGGEVPRSADARPGAEPGYEQGGIEIAWGRFFDKLPWPKRDRKKAEEHLRKALEMNPNALRPRVYLASSFLDSRPRDRGEAPAGRGRRGGPGPLRRARGAPGAGAGAGADADAAGEAEVGADAVTLTLSPLRGAGPERGRGKISGAMRARRRALLRPSRACSAGSAQRAWPSGGSRSIGSK